LGSSSYSNDNYRISSYELRRFRDTLHNGRIAVPVLDISVSDTFNVKYDINQYTSHVDAIDQQYYFYYLTRSEGNSGDDIFGTTGLNIRGNIRGAIGLFIGMTSTSKKIEIK
jgi:hypothetical protein